MKAGLGLRIFFVFAIAVALVAAFVVYTFTQPVSDLRIIAGVSPDYGFVNATIYLDGKSVGDQNVSWTAGLFDRTFSVVPGHHTVEVEWSVPVDGMRNESKRADVRPFSTGGAYFTHGFGMI
jgi:hypothetical protein